MKKRTIMIIQAMQKDNRFCGFLIAKKEIIYSNKTTIDKYISENIKHYLKIELNDKIEDYKKNKFRCQGKQFVSNTTQEYFYK